MVWHEIQIFGMLTDDEPLDIVVKMAEREHKFTYKVADVNDITHTAKSYVHFSPAPVITQTDLDADYTYFMLISDPHIENNLHFARFRQSQKRGEMTENLIYEKYPILWFDIMFQRLFLIKCLSAKIDKMNEVQLDAIAHMLSTNQNIDRILDAILQRKKHTKTIRHKTSLSNVHTPHNRTRRVTQRTGGKKRNKNNT
jgi:hypothetical protein